MLEEITSRLESVFKKIRGQILVFKPLSTVLVLVLGCVACVAEPALPQNRTA